MRRIHREKHVAIRQPVPLQEFMFNLALDTFKHSVTQSDGKSYIAGYRLVDVTQVRSTGSVMRQRTVRTVSALSGPSEPEADVNATTSVTHGANRLARNQGSSLFSHGLRYDHICGLM